MLRTALILLLTAKPGLADTLVAANTIRAQAILGPGDVTVLDRDTPGALTDPDDVIGKEARVVLYAGRPIRPGDVGAPALIERNQIVPLVYDHAGLTITAEGRSLARAAAGERVRVMNLSSRTTVSGTLDAAGRVHVGPPDTATE